MATTQKLLCRVLVATIIAGQEIQPNKLVKGDEALLKPLVDAGQLSSDKAGIEYCTKTLKEEVIDLDKPESEESDDTGSGSTDKEE